MKRFWSWRYRRLSARIDRLEERRNRAADRKWPVIVIEPGVIPALWVKNLLDDVTRPSAWERYWPPENET